MGVEIGLAHPVLVKDEKPRIVGRDVEVLVEAALLAPCGGAHGKKGLAQSLLLAGLGAVVGDNGDLARHLSALTSMKIAGLELS